jgi:hypothetical protein
VCTPWLRPEEGPHRRRVAHRLEPPHAGPRRRPPAGRLARVLGAHVLGERAGEVINLFAPAVRHGISASELRHGVYAYPTYGSDIPYTT